MHLCLHLVATLLAVSFGLVLVMLEFMYSTKPFLISGAKRLPHSLKSFLYSLMKFLRSTAVFILNNKNLSNMSSLKSYI